MENKLSGTIVAGKYIRISIMALFFLGVGIDKKSWKLALLDLVMLQSGGIAQARLMSYTSDGMVFNDDYGAEGLPTQILIFSNMRAKL